LGVKFVGIASRMTRELLNHPQVSANKFAPHPNENRYAASATGHSLWFIVERAGLAMQIPVWGAERQNPLRG